MFSTINLHPVTTTNSKILQPQVLVFWDVSDPKKPRETGEPEKSSDISYSVIDIAKKLFFLLTMEYLFRLIC